MSSVWFVVWTIVCIFLRGLVVVVEGVVELMVVVVACKSWVVAFREGPSCLVVASFQGEPFQLNDKLIEEQII